MVESESRLLWWAGGAVIDLLGTWLAHPLPGRMLHSENVEFDADHMIERCRLFLLIALGESVLTSGFAITDAPRTLMTLVTGACALVTIVALWALYFGGSDHLVNRHVETTTDPIFAARMAVNVLLVVVAGLIALAVGNELVITHPHAHISVTLSLLLFGGRSSICCRRRTTCGRSSGRGRCHGWPASPRWYWRGLSRILPPYGALGLLTTLLLVLAVIAVREGDARSSRLLPHRQT
jgi:low temperature requirement protein LtrA